MVFALSGECSSLKLSALFEEGYLGGIRSGKLL